MDLEPLPTDGAASEAAVSQRLRVTHEVVLAAVLVAEIAVFCAIGTNFMTWKNAFEITRLFVEVGLLAVAMTPVIISGGIDLSVGSLMGFSAVLFGMLWRDVHLPIPVAVVGTLLAGAAAGGLNGVLIARLRLPPLIVTLGTYSLFRGLAEGLTRGVDNFTGLPDSFLFLGQGFLFGWVPAQLPIFVVVTIWLLDFAAADDHWPGLVCDWVFSGRGAICGDSGRAAADAGLRFVGADGEFGGNHLCGALGASESRCRDGLRAGSDYGGGFGGYIDFWRARHDSGNGVGAGGHCGAGKRAAIGRATGGAGRYLDGVLLLATISLERWSTRRTRASKAISVSASTIEGGEFDVKNSQVAVLCVVILLGAAIVAASNWWLMRNFVQQGAHANKKLTVAMMPKSKGNAYFIACRKGAEEAARELGVDLIWDGPTDPDPAKQNEIIEAWITRGVDVIAVSAENRDAISSVLKKARRAGSGIITFDADTGPDSREYFVNQATPEEIGYKLMDRAADVTAGKGEFAVITASLTAANQNEWLKYIEKRRASLYPEMKMAVLRACDDLQKKAFDETTTILNAYPEVKVIMAICSPAVPGAAEAVKQSGART